MDAIEAVLTRRSIGRVKDDLPPKADIEAMLEAATRAPNHYMTEPWRFYVLTGEARERLGDVFADVVEDLLTQKGETVHPARLDAERKKALRSPVLIAVVMNPKNEEGIILTEEIQATAAAIQNMLIVAHAKGLGAQWRTGDYAYHPKTRAFFDLPEQASIAGFIYVGYPNTEPADKPRTPFEEKTQWLGLENW